MTEKLNTRPYVSLSSDRANTEPFIPPPRVSPDADVSLFDVGMPGALTVAQVEALDLDHWLLFFRKNFVHMEVSFPFSSQLLGGVSLANSGQDLVGWETMSMTEPQSVKGIVAELAAVLGPKVVKDSAVDLFG